MRVSFYFVVVAVGLAVGMQATISLAKGLKKIQTNRTVAIEKYLAATE